MSTGKMKSLLIHLALTCIGTVLVAESLMLEPIIAWFGMVNVLLFTVMGKDKLAAQTNRTRTPESTLLGLALLGGFPGLFTGRRVFNHKTSKRPLIITMWILFCAQLLAATWWMGGSLEDIGFTKKDHTETQHTPN